MWSYYGSKNRIAKYYPKPIFDDIEERFAGAGYFSLLYFEKNVTLIDKSQMVIDIWHYLQEASIKDIMSLPVLPRGFKISRDMFDCDGQYNLMRFLIVQAAYGGNNVVSKWGAMRFEANRKRVATNLFKCKHWTIKQGEYYDGDCNKKATWFIDPPYTHGGDKYPMKAKYIDFEKLANWCKGLNGQVMVCENTKADWLPFVPLTKMNGVAHQTTEAIWTNYHTHYNNVQQELIL